MSRPRFGQWTFDQGCAIFLPRLKLLINFLVIIITACHSFYSSKCFILYIFGPVLVQSWQPKIPQYFKTVNQSWPRLGSILENQALEMTLSSQTFTNIGPILTIASVVQYWPDRKFPIRLLFFGFTFTQILVWNEHFALELKLIQDLTFSVLLLVSNEIRHWGNRMIKEKPFDGNMLNNCNGCRSVPDGTYRGTCR